MSDAAANALLAYCRSGFEGDVAAEVTDRAAALGIPLYCTAAPDTAHVLINAVEPDGAKRLHAALPWASLVFPRQWLRVVACPAALPPDDRITPLTAALADAGRKWTDPVLEYPDTNDGKALSRFCRAFGSPLRASLGRAGLLTDRPGAPRLHLFFLDSRRVIVAESDPGNASPWPLGIPRLRLPRGAPSRSTLKLDEAIRVLVADTPAASTLAPGATAVDLGAAPGGWTWQLAQRHMRVTAVDNGPMDADLLASGLVTHVRADGFRYRPAQPVDWLVCDIVEQPHRINRLMIQWLRRGDARHAVFNLKLPMKRRWAAVADALSELREALPDHRIRCRQLYHDREEVTVAALS